LNVMIRLVIVNHVNQVELKVYKLCKRWYSHISLSVRLSVTLSLVLQQNEQRLDNSPNRFVSKFEKNHPKRVR